ncbi:Glial cell line-derived neurotrophic protein, putative [Babesia ovata]|uniref:Glial cell line-derived neurotrophic protein, putative n=1 Tax=Babesia ovata TaxID=189622 RepID=A0A2H6KBZ4_9APIC|nr:Glial cell line-derived neurotrophic protein, putative [Babesia ovata]GBE60507.1 Glial cell line-derived neurotrophic protein, putative [Babesia ovata]
MLGVCFCLLSIQAFELSHDVFILDESRSREFVATNCGVNMLLNHVELNVLRVLFMARMDLGLVQHLLEAPLLILKPLIRDQLEERFRPSVSSEGHILQEVIVCDDWRVIITRRKHPLKRSLLAVEGNVQLELAQTRVTLRVDHNIEVTEFIVSAANSDIFNREVTVKVGLLGTNRLEPLSTPSPCLNLVTCVNDYKVVSPITKGKNPVYASTVRGGVQHLGPLALTVPYSVNYGRNILTPLSQVHIFEVTITIINKMRNATRLFVPVNIHRQRLVTRDEGDVGKQRRRERSKTELHFRYIYVPTEACLEAESSGMTAAEMAAHGMGSILGM